LVIRHGVDDELGDRSTELQACETEDVGYHAKYRRIIVALIDVTYCGTARALASGPTTLPLGFLIHSERETAERPSQPALRRLSPVADPR